MTFGLTESDYELLMKLAVHPLKRNGAKIWIFGSRARGDFKRFSDVDLLYEFPASFVVPPNLLFKIKDDVEESNITVKVDIVDRKDLASSYAAGVERDKVQI